MSWTESAVRRLGVRTGDCVALEDSPAGVRSAVAAGVPTLAIPHVVDVPDIPGAVRVTTLAGLTPFDLLTTAHAHRDAGP